MPVWLVCDETALGDNSDLFVSANTSAGAVEIWRDYYELDADAQPDRVIRVPTATAPGAIAWDTVEQHILRGN